MTVRTAELLMAIFMVAASIGLMIKSAELNIGWIEGRGPGAGAWPFWLSALLLISALLTLVRWFMRITPESRSTEQYIERENLFIVAVTAGLLVGLLLLTAWIGMYFALMVFLFAYIKLVGHHGWVTTIGFMIGTPIFIFLLFEWALAIPIPKGISEPLFYPLYDIIY